MNIFAPNFERLFSRDLSIIKIMLFFWSYFTYSKRQTLSSNFYRATLCVARLVIVILSVCPSVCLSHSWTV